MIGRSYQVGTDYDLGKLRVRVHDGTRVGETDVRMAPGARLQVLGTKWDVSGTLYCEGFLWSVCWP